MPTKTEIQLSPHRNSFLRFASPDDNSNTTLHRVFKNYFPVSIQESKKFKMPSNTVDTSAILDAIEKKGAFSAGQEERSALEKGLEQIDISTLTSLNRSKQVVIDYVSYELKSEKYTEMNCLNGNRTYQWLIRGKFEKREEIQWSSNGKVIAIYEHKIEIGPITIGRLPRITERCSFIINGRERAPIAQILPAYGILFEARQNNDDLSITYTATIHPQRGKRLRFSLREADNEKKRGLVEVEVMGEGKPFALGDFLKGMGFFEKVSEYLKTDFPEFLNNATGKPEEKKTDEERKREAELPDILSRLNDHFFTDKQGYWLSERGRKRLNEKLMLTFTRLNLQSPPPDAMYLTFDDITASLYYLFSLLHSKEKYSTDDFLHLKHREVLLVGDQLEKIAYRAVYDMREAVEEALINNLDMTNALSPHLDKRLQPFFTGELCETLDATNPLAEVAQKRKLTHFGPGGYESSYVPLDWRDVHYSHYGRICPCETPESTDIGLKLHFAAYATVDEEGQITAPYFEYGKASGQPKKLTAAEEEQHLIIPANASPLFGRLGEEEITIVTEEEKVKYQDAMPGQFLGLSAMQIPFIGHNDAARNLMGSKNLKQAVPLLKPEHPLVKTGMEEELGRLCRRAIFAKSAGKVKRIVKPADEEKDIFPFDAKEIVLQREDGEEESYPLLPLSPTISHTHLAHKPIVKEGDTVKAGDVLADGAGMKKGELALGVNLLVAYMPWEGYNFEDAIVISQRLVDEDILTSWHLRDIEETLGEGEITFYDADEEAKESALELSEEGIIKEGADISPETVLIRKYRPYRRGEDKGKPKRIKGVDYFPKPMDIKAKVSGKVLKTQRFRHGGGEFICIRILTVRKVTVGDKLMGRHGNKGVVAKILPVDEMPRLPDGTPVDVLLNPHGVVSRMNLGQLFETHLGWIIKRKGEHSRTVGAFETVKLEDLRAEFAFLRSKAQEEGKPLDNEIDENGKIKLINPQTKKPYEHPVVVGYQYIVKLNHLSEEKIHAREQGESLEDYTLITQQPPRGKERDGGLRIGEMEVWAILAHQAFDTLNEFMTFKSDDIEGRESLLKDILDGKIPPNLSKWFFGGSLPEAFRIFLMYLKGVGIRPIIHTIDSQTSSESELENFAFRHHIKSEDVKALSLHIATSEEIQSWGSAVTDSRLYPVKYVDVELTCGCRGEKKTALVSQNPLICAKHGELVRLSCGHAGDLQRITEVELKCGCRGDFMAVLARRNPLTCKKHGIQKGKENESQKSDTKKYPKYHCKRCGSEVDVKRLLSVINEEETMRYPKDGLFSEEIFGKLKKEERREKMGHIPLAKFVTKFELNLDDNPRLRQEKDEDENIYQIVVEHPLFEDCWLSVIPVIPPDLRPALTDISAIHPLNRLYQQVIVQNKIVEELLNNIAKIVSQKEEEKREKNQSQTALKRLERQEKDLKDKLFEQIGKPEQTGELQKAVDALFVDGWKDRGREYPSIMHLLRGKEGLLRWALSGKRVNFSGRAVIVPEPETISPSECLLPVPIAQKLLGKIFNVYSKDELEAAIRERNLLVLLSRPPTLHKYNLLAFKLRLTDEATIGVHPLVCGGFNADFDGDAMGVFLPLTTQGEIAKMTLANNLFSAANGGLMLSFTQDIALGWYAATLNANSVGQMRQILEFPREQAPIKKRDISTLLVDYYHNNQRNAEKLLQKAQQVMEAGLKQATLSCLSFGIFDVPLIGQQEREAEFDRIREDGKGDIYDRWRDAVKLMLDEELSKEPDNPISMLVKSGARGDLDIVTQLGGLRGLMSKPGGGFYEQPVRSNFTEGLSPLEFFVSTHGSRKSMADKQLKTGEAGDLTRRMVESAYTLDIVTDDCGAEEGITVEDIIPLSTKIPLTESTVGKRLARDVVVGEHQYELGQEITKEVFDRLVEAGISDVHIWLWAPVKMSARIVGRFSLQNDEASGIQEGRVITEEMAAKFTGRKLKVRSPLTCQAENGICQKCYGIDLSKGIPRSYDNIEEYLPAIGLPVGIIAAQSIGERGTQLTMRTFHTGGVKGEDITQGLPRVRNILDNWRLPLMMYRITERGTSKLSKDDELNEWELLQTLRQLREEQGVTAEFPEYEPIYYITKQGSSIFEVKANEKEIQKFPRVTESELFAELKGLRERKSQGEMVTFPEYAQVVERVRPSDIYEACANDDGFLLFYLTEMHKAYKGVIHDKHFEVVLHSIKAQRNGSVTIQGITKAAQSREGFLSQAAFQRAQNVIIRAARNEERDTFSDPKSKYIVGKRLK